MKGEQMSQAAAASLSVSKRVIELVANGSLPKEGLLLYKQLHSNGFHGAPSFLPSLFKVCTSSPLHLHFAVQLHCVLHKTALASDLVTTNSLLSMYSKHSHVRSARLLFDTIPRRDSVTWHSMVNCYIINERFSEALNMFRQMHSAGCAAKPELTAAILSVCGRRGSLSLGTAFHAHCIVTDQEAKCVLLLTSLVDMYSRCHDLDSALQVFDSMPERNVVSWTAMITGLVLNGRYDMSIELLREMWMDGIQPNRATLVSILPACGELGYLIHGKELHGYVVRHSFESEQQVTGALIDMYGKCRGAFKLASFLFDRAELKDVVIWSSMMVISSRHGDFAATLRLYQMMQDDGLKVNSVTILAVLKACIGLTNVSLGRAVHGYIFKCDFLSEISVGNSLIDMYAKCGCLECSICMFAEMQVKDLVSYSCMIASYGLRGHGYQALNLFNELLDVGIQLDGITFLTVLSACNHSGLVVEGKQLFDTVRRDHGNLLVLEHYACLIDLLGRSGWLDEACEVMKNMPMKPSPKMVSSLVSACRTACQFEAAKSMALWLIGLEPENAANYALLSVIYAEAGDWFQVEETRRQMRMLGLKKSSGSSKIPEINDSISTDDNLYYY